MNDIKVLVLMQLRDKIDLSFTKSKKKTLFFIVFTFIMLAVTIIALYFAFFATVQLHILTITLRLDVKVLVFIFAVMQTFSLISLTLSLSKSLYFGEDNRMLFVLPVTPNKVFISKLIVHYITELKKNFLYTAPIFIAFGLVNSYSLAFYPLVILGFFFISLFVMLLAAILSIPTMGIIALLKRFYIIQMVLFGILLTLITVVVFYLVAQIPPDFNIIRDFGEYFWNIQDFLSLFQRIFKPFAYITTMISGNAKNSLHTPLPLSSVITFLVLIASTAILVVLITLITRPLFFKMAAKSFEFKGKHTKNSKQNKQSTQFASSIKKEVLMTLRSPAAFFQNFVFIFTLPLAIYLMNKIFASMDKRLLGDNLANSFNFLIFLLILLTNNIANASLFSREGKAFYLLKAQSTSLKSIVLSKLCLDYALSLVSIIITCIFFGVVASLSVFTVILIVISVLCIHTSHILWSIDLDIMNPQLSRYLFAQHTASNPNEIRSAIIAFAFSFIFFGIALFLLLENAGLAWIKIAIIAAILLAVRIYLNVNRTKLYFRNI